VFVDPVTDRFVHDHISFLLMIPFYRSNREKTTDH